MVSNGPHSAPILFKIIDFFLYLGAPYHRAKGTKEMLERLQIPITPKPQNPKELKNKYIKKIFLFGV